MSEFKECTRCASIPGTPTLCSDCLRRRAGFVVLVLKPETVKWITGYLEDALERNDVYPTARDQVESILSEWHVYQIAHDRRYR